MHIYVTVLNTDIGFICHLRRAVYRSTGLHGPKEDDDDDDDDLNGFKNWESLPNRYSAL